MAFHDDIIKLTTANDFFRREIITVDHSQIVVMSVQPDEDIGTEVHEVDQILIFLEGEGEAVIDNDKYIISPNDIFVVPAGTKHNFTNTGEIKMKLFTIYAPPEHKPGTIVKSKKDLGDEE